MHSQNSVAGSIAAIGSITAAIKAQRALNRAGLAAEIVSLSPAETRRGCAYGLSYPIAQDSAVKRALRAAGVSVSQYLRRSENEP